MATPYYDHAGITIYHGDCLEILPELGAVDLAFTSPPYLNQRSYGLDNFDWYAVVPKAIASIPLTDTGQILVNLGLKHDAGRVVRYWDAMIDTCEAAGLRLFGWYVWDQGSGLPGNWSGRLGPSHEWVFHFNRRAVVLPKPIPNKRKGEISFRSRRGHGRDKATPFTNPRVPIMSHRIADSVFRSKRSAIDDKYLLCHPAVFSIDFATAVLRAFPGETILDPFMGSGTTLRAAKDLGRRAIGIEIEERYCEIAAKRLAQEVLPLGVASA
jgi:DNA modification methylase